MSCIFQPDQYPAPLPVDHPTLGHHLAESLQGSLYRVAAQLISVLPGVLAFILALAVMIAIGVLLSWVARRILTAANFDQRLALNRASNVSDWSPQHSPTLLIGRAIFWLFVVFGLMIGISAFDASYETGTTLRFALLPYLTRAIEAILLLLFGNLIARYLERTVLIGAVNNQLQYARILSIGVKWLVLVLTAAMVLDHLRIGGGIVELAFGILFGGIVLTLALAVGLGSRDLVTRSLERTGERPEPTSHRPVTAPKSTETLRHF